MFTFTVSRITRGPAPKKTFSQSSYRKAIDFLLRDTKDRCGYSMQHLQRAGGKKCMEVDHFKPKGKNRHHYGNLIPATRHCNGAKSQTWPTAAQMRKGVRLLNPFKEHDYGVHIFENAKTNELIGVTPEGRFHIIVCDLNAEHLLRERRDRAEILQILREKPAIVRGSMAGLPEVVAALRDQVNYMIPEIPHLPPPN